MRHTQARRVAVACVTDDTSSFLPFNPDNPAFIPQDRLFDNTLTPLLKTDPTVTYQVSGLPTGSTFDPVSAQCEWKPTFTQAGTYNVTVVATDEGTGSAPGAAPGQGWNTLFDVCSLLKVVRFGAQKLFDFGYRTRELFSHIVRWRSIGTFVSMENSSYSGSNRPREDSFQFVCSDILGSN